MKKDKNIIDEAPVPDNGTDAPVSSDTKKKNKKQKIVLICVFLGFCIVGALSWFLLYGLPEKNSNPMFDPERLEEKDAIGMYGSTQSYIFYPIDHDLDIMTEKEYLDLDRNLYYTRGSETVAVTEDSYKYYSDDVLFFVEYFKLATAGEYEKYNALFTENYYESNEAYYSFTQQMIYDMHIEKLDEDNRDGTDYYTYNVSYRIHKNNGTFRNDIESDASKKLLYTLVEENGTILIDSINYYK